MLTEPEAADRAIAAASRAILAITSTPQADLMTIVKAIRAEFAIPDDWQVVEHRVGVWSLVNQRTGEPYTGNARGKNKRRLIAFKTVENARRKAYYKNKALMK